LELVLDLNYFSFSSSNPTHFPNHQILSPNHQFSQRICDVEYYSMQAHMAWCQKFRLTPGSTNLGEEKIASQGQKKQIQLATSSHKNVSTSKTMCLVGVQQARLNAWTECIFIVRFVFLHDVFQRHILTKKQSDSSDIFPGRSPGYSSRRGQKPERRAKNQKGGHKYCIGCMQQPGGQTWNRGHRFQMGGQAPLAPPLATTLYFSRRFQN